MKQTNILSSFAFLAALIGVAALLQLRSSLRKDAIPISPVEKKGHSHIVEQLEDCAEGLRSLTASEVQSIVDHASACKLSVIFVDAKWSVNAKFFRPAFSRLVVGYHTEFPNEDVRFHFVDGTDGFDSLRTLPGYQEVANNKFHGNGEILWLVNGRVVHMSSVTSNHDSDDLIRLTQELVKNAG